MSTKKPILTVTIKDCEVQYYRGHGPGGQKKNKTYSAVRVIHQPAGARGESQESRSQDENRKLAFKRMAESSKFKLWIKMESLRKIGVLMDIEKNVDKMMRPENLVVEVQEDGRWVKQTTNMS